MLNHSFLVGHGVYSKSFKSEGAASGSNRLFFYIPFFTQQRQQEALFAWPYMYI